jgi:ubiquinone biosynthesis protein COQ9
MQNVTDVQDRIILAALPLAAADGWSHATLSRAAQDAGYSDSHIRMVFPDGLSDAVAHVSHWADRQMLAHLPVATDLGVRARIHHAVLTRWTVLEPYKAAIAAAARYYTVPWHAPAARKALWHTADTIWTWAGDASTDYNFYTKRTLLAGVLAVSTPVWLQQEREEAAAFLQNRLDNVVTIGRTLGQVMSVVRGRGAA